MKQIKLDVGCGRKKRRGYFGCDIRALPNIDYVCQADKLPFKSKTVDEIYSRHFIEHLTLKEFLKALAEWKRVLRRSGRLYIICPNLLWHLKQILKGSHGSFYKKERGSGNDRYWGMASLFGWQANSHDVHKFGYYFELLKDILEDAGFENIRNRTNKREGVEHAPWHLEISARSNGLDYDYKASRFYKHFDVKH